MSKICKVACTAALMCLLAVPLLGNNDPMQLPRFSMVAQPIQPNIKGHNIQFVVELVNNTGEDLKITTADENPPFGIKVYDQKGRDLNNLTLEFKSSSDSSRRDLNLIFAPYEKKVFPLTLSTYKDKERTLRKYPSGKYKVSTILAIRSSLEEPPYTQDKATVLGLYKIELAESNEIEIVTGNEKSIPLPHNIAIRMAPQALTWQPGEAPNPKTIRIEAIGQTPVKLLGVKPTHNQFTATLRTLEAGKAYEVTVTPATTVTPADGVLRFETEPALASLLDIPTVVIEPERAPSGTSADPPAR